LPVDHTRQFGDFAGCQSPGQIAKPAVERCDHLIERRINPSVKLRAHNRPTILTQLSQDIGGLRIGRNRVIDQVPKRYVMVGKSDIRLRRGGHGRGCTVFAGERSAPVKLPLGIGKDNQARAQIVWPIDPHLRRLRQNPIAGWRRI